jgi:hypothetical protein
MKKAQIVEVDYDDFMKQLIVAKREFNVIEPLEKEKWARQVMDRGLKATAFSMVAKERYQAEELFLMTGKAPWEGLFAIDRETRTCIHFSVIDME